MSQALAGEVRVAFSGNLRRSRVGQAKLFRRPGRNAAGQLASGSEHTWIGTAVAFGAGTLCPAGGGFFPDRFASIRTGHAARRTLGMGTPARGASGADSSCLFYARVAPAGASVLP